MAAASPPRLIRFRFIPASLIKMKVMSNATGIIMMVTRVIRNLLKNRRRIKNVSKAPRNMASRTLLMAALIKSVISYHFVSSMFRGITPESSPRRCSTSFMIETAFVPGCLITVTRTAGFKLLSHAINVSLTAGSISAISDR